MSQFSGFPTSMEFTPIPNIFISQVLPQITDIVELKVTLHFFRLLSYKKAYPRFLTYRELVEDAALMGSISEVGKKPEETLKQGLKLAVQRGTILHLVLEGNTEGFYFLNVEPSRDAIAKIQRGEVRFSGLETKGAYLEVVTETRPNVFILYEENIGLLTPMIAEQLKDAEKLYPEAWIKDAIKEAVNAGKRNWRYISAILERWATEGRSDGTHLRNFKKTDPDKFIKGKYGHVFKR